MIVFCLGGLVNIIIILDKRFGLLGNKGPTIDDLMTQVKLIQNNHLHELPDMAQTLENIDSKVDKLAIRQIDFGERIVRVETLLKIGVK